MHRTKKEKTLMMPTSLPLTAAFIEIPPNAYTGLAVSLMFLAGEAEHIGGRRTSKKKKTQPADKRRYQATEETCPTFHPGTIGLSCYRVWGRGDRGWLLSEKERKIRDRERGRGRERECVCGCQSSSLLLNRSIGGGKQNHFPGDSTKV